MICPFCGKRLLQLVDGKAKLRSPVLIFSMDGAKCSLVCPKCSNEVEVPVQISEKAIQSAAHARVTLSR